MTCSLSPNALTTVESATQYLGSNAPTPVTDVQAMEVWYVGIVADGTVEVTSNNRMILRQEGLLVENIDLSLYTFSTLREQILTHPGWQALLIEDGSVDATWLQEFPETDVKGTGNENKATLLYSDYCELVNWINIASDRVEKYINRIIPAQDHMEFYSTRHQGKLVIKNWPLLKVYRVSPGRRGVLTIKNSAPDAVQALVRKEGNTITFTVVGGSFDGDDPIDITDPGRETLDGLVAGINGLGKTWEASYSPADLANMPSTDILDTGGKNVFNQDVLFDAVADARASYVTDFEKGIVRVHGRSRFTGDARNWWSDYWTRPGAWGPVNDSLYVNHPTFWWQYPGSEWVVHYRGGFEEIPYEIEWITNDVIRQLIQIQQQSSSTLQSEKLGDLSKTWRSGVEADEALVSSLRDRLAHWANRYF